MQTNPTKMRSYEIGLRLFYTKHSLSKQLIIGHGAAAIAFIFPVILASIYHLEYRLHTFYYW